MRHFNLVSNYNLANSTTKSRDFDEVSNFDFTDKSELVADLR